MALELYDPCPCGSGKKFKWCCLPIHVEIDRAFRQEADGQHAAAMRIMDEVTAAHPDNPEPLGRKAQLLYQHGQFDDAENVLQKAFDLNPTYPFGLFLRGMFRLEEGEAKGALLSFRKAAESYDPQAHDQLGRIYSLIAESELKMNRPVAARAALKLALHYHPADEELRKGAEQFFSGQARLPAVVQKDFAFQRLPAGAGEAREAAWSEALATAAGKLAEAACVFEGFTKADEQNAAAWFNLGLSRAWLGENRAALEAFDRYVALEPDEARAAEAWALGEVLRQAHDMEDVSDFVEQSYLYQIRDMEPFFQLLDVWQRERRFVPVQVNQEQQMFTGLILEKTPPLLAPELAATQVVGLGAYLFLVADHLRIWHVNPAALLAVRQELVERCGNAMAEVRGEKGPASFNDLLADVHGFPVQAPNAEKAQELVLGHAQRFFEETWIHRPLKSLSGVTPLDAAGSKTLRKKLLGVIQFVQECMAYMPSKDYDFDRLRRKLGLLDAATPVAAAGSAPDVAALGAAELSALSTEGLAEGQLEQAYQAALKLDARELAGRFARALVAQPVPAGQLRDRYAWFSHLVQTSVTAGDADAALNYVNEGEKDDCEHNEGRRRNDYELRRGQLHARRGETDAAVDVFDRLVQRVPAELRYRGSAAEAMLSARRGDKALHFAEDGLAKAREKNDRDSEQYFLELVDAARRMG